MRRYSNFNLHLLEGVFYTVGVSIVGVETILPGILAQLGARPWMVSLAPALLMLGAALPATLVVRVIDRLPRKMGFMLRTGVPLQRVPYIVLVVSLLAVSDPGVLSWLVFLAVFAAGLGTGIIVPPWYRLVAKTVDAKLLPRLFALRLLFAGIVGIGGGFLVKLILSSWPNRFGYALLYFCASVFLCCSWYTFCQIREPVESPERLRANSAAGRSYFELFRDRNIRNYLFVRMFYCGIFFAAGFIPVEYCRTLELDEGYLGIFAALVIAGTVFGNLFTVWWTRKHTARSAVIIALSGYLLVFVLSLHRDSLAGAFLVFFLMGFSRDMWTAAGGALMVTLPPRRMLGMATAMMQVVMAAPILLAGYLGGKVFEWTNTYAVSGCIAAGLMIPAIYFASKLPRGR